MRSIPYGHGKLESLATVVGATFLLVIGSKEVLFRILTKAGRRLGSSTRGTIAPMP
jgi:hypothetical protein